MNEIGDTSASRQPPSDVSTRNAIRIHQGKGERTTLMLPVVDPWDDDDHDLLVVEENTRVTLRIVSLLDVDNVAHFMCQALRLASASQSVESCCLIRAQGEM